MREMISFEKAYNKTMKNEGGYANNPKDKGGETYKGISRKFHPNWGGWKYIDDYKIKHPAFTAKSINKGCNTEAMNNLVKTFYKDTFWKPLCLDNCFSQLMAEELFDDAVNRGVAGAKRILCNILGLSKTAKMETVIAKYNDIWKRRILN